MAPFASRRVAARFIRSTRAGKPMRELILDLDSSVSETYGEQEGTAYNGHFGCTCYHPLFCFNQFGDVERTLLREGNVHRANDWRAVLPRAVQHWTLTTLREKLIKIGAKVVRHARQVIFQMAEVAIPQELFRTILERIGWLRLPMPLTG